MEKPKVFNKFRVITKTQEFRISGVFVLNSDGEFCMNLGYGYTHIMVGRSCHQVLPSCGDIFIHNASGRKFEVGSRQGYIDYKYPLLENGVVKAYLLAEEYYKD